jgi:hypothetical protein
VEKYTGIQELIIRGWSEADKAGMVRFHTHVNPAKNQYGARYLQTVRRFFCYFDL